MPSAAALLAVALLGACAHHIPGPKWVLKPEGETVVVRPAQGAPLAGELLGLVEENLILLRSARLVMVPLDAAALVEIEGYGRVKATRVERLALYARYPQGLSDEQWRELLRQRGQEDFDRLPE